MFRHKDIKMIVRRTLRRGGGSYGGEASIICLHHLRPIRLATSISGFLMTAYKAISTTEQRRSERERRAHEFRWPDLPRAHHPICAAAL